MPDPTLLPTASPAQVPALAAYAALNVPALAAGSFYADPTTGIKVHKLSSSVSPAASLNWTHGYAEGGDAISLPHTGATRTVLIRQDNQDWYLIDFTPGVGVSNSRKLTGDLIPTSEVSFAFSNNPATPKLAYVATYSGVITRFDVTTMLPVPGTGWPLKSYGPGQYDWPVWMHQAENDSFFTWMWGFNGPTVVGYEPSTGTIKTVSIPNTNEPRVDRAGRYVGISLAANGLAVWDFLANVVTWTMPGDPGIPVAHQASLRHRVMGVEWNVSFPDQFWVLDPSTPNSAKRLPGPTPGGGHCNGNWIQHPTNLDDQWASSSIYGQLVPTPVAAGWLSPGGIVLFNASGGRRLLCHSYNTRGPNNADYPYLTFPKFSSDGAFLLFNSDMNGSGRTDVFLAELPGAAIVPSPIDITSPIITGVTPSAITQTSAVVAWTTNELADSEVEYGPTTAYGFLASLSLSITTAHSQLLVGLSPGTLYHYRVKSKDVAGNLAVSGDFTFTTQAAPPPPVPPVTALILQVVDPTGKVLGKVSLT